MVKRLNRRVGLYIALIALIVPFLSVQHAVATHELSHLSDTVVAAQSEPGQPLPDSTLHTCDKCSGYAGMANVLHATSLTIQWQGLVYHGYAHPPVVISFVRLHSYSSRAPPQLV
jgi:hypothetical protein